MVKVIGIDHLAIRVSDLARSKQFYNRVLGFMGFSIEWEFDRVVGWTNGETMFWITEADEQGRKHHHRTGDVGFHHYAFEVARYEDVDALYGVLLKENVTIVDAPAAYPSYGEGYYAVYFLDPDGLKLEVMFFLEKQKRRAARTQ
ncbi:MAG: VOC family protein [Gibbsiella quercinecans]|uniref:Glyoxalase n=3 Tax=Gibbsiella TaxID=929812 RepID=A0A250B5Q1_9GAMM|nr:VOC family protein [Gibbsiella quercinecans]ATA21578.1 glyoxalase [Gibbsiella quercinecans]RLM02901.1 glyoxalase [Gibbsiella quercinecans]RLM06194.1 glyoxalase [Gibbsiella quercinecans]RLM15288.1 glyoxalase [Gibbsiella quercinecans]TCT88818.1 catechol 2,3-dioxygenase-like lactoylglutathione lyase family enzyme [Gibbsiella quercinecans]